MRWSFQTPEEKGVCKGPARRTSSSVKSSLSAAVGGRSSLVGEGYCEAHHDRLLSGGGSLSS